MFRVLVVLLLTVAGLKAVAVDADFNGEYRFRVSSGSDTGDNLVDNLGTNLSSEIRAKVSGSFRPSESFEGVAGLYLDVGANILALQDQMVAYGDWMISDEFMLRAGQSTYKIADGSVLGINDYDSVPSLFKGLFLTHSSENVGLDVALIQNRMVNDLFVVSVDARSFPDLVKTANFHLIVKDVKQKMGLEEAMAPVVPVVDEILAASEGETPADDGADEEDDSKGVYLGATLGGGAAGFGYKLTASTNSLKNVLSDVNLLVDGKVSYSVEMDNASLKVFVGGHRDGANYEPLLYEKHYNAGKMDRAFWGNGLTYAYAGLSYRASSDWKMGVKGYYFIETNEISAVSDKDMEVDVYVKTNFNSSVSGKVWAGVLVPDSGDNASLVAQAVLNMKF